MISGNSMRALVLTAAVFGCAVAAAQADESDTMTKTVEVMIDKLDPTAKAGNNPAGLCAAYGEGLGLIKSFRIVADECLDEGDPRTQSLSSIARSGSCRARSTRIANDRLIASAMGGSFE